MSLVVDFSAKHIHYSTQLKNLFLSCMLDPILQGDSGGPLVVRYGGAAFITGILSFGPSICDGSGHDRYTRASFFAPWVQAVVNQ